LSRSHSHRGCHPEMQREPCHELVLTVISCVYRVMAGNNQARPMALFFALASFGLIISAVVVNSWAVFTVGDDRNDHIGLFRHCTAANDCCSPGTAFRARQCGRCCLIRTISWCRIHASGAWSWSCWPRAMRTHVVVWRSRSCLFACKGVGGRPGQSLWVASVYVCACDRGRASHCTVWLLYSVAGGPDVATFPPCCGSLLVSSVSARCVTCPGTPSVVASHAVSGMSRCCVSPFRCWFAVDGNRWCKLFGDLSNTCPEYHKFQTTRAFAVIEILAAGLFTVALFSNAQGAGQRIAALAFGVLASTSLLPFLSSLTPSRPSRPSRPSPPASLALRHRAFGGRA
jgi:hypothetical protein